MPEVSILMPARNAEKTVQEAVESCLNQTFSDLELVVVNDGSTDGTREILSQILREDSRLKVLNNPSHLGIVPTLQRAYAASSGSFLARMDADDFAYPSRIAEQVAYMKEHPNVAVCGCGVRILKRGQHHLLNRIALGYERYEKWINGVNTPDEILRERFIESPVPHPTALIRREAYERIGGYRNSDWPEDYDLWLRLLQSGFVIAKLPKILLDWYDTDERSSRTLRQYSPVAFIKLKAHFIAALQMVQQRGIQISGAGWIGKKIAFFVKENNINIHNFWEVSPKTIGRSLNGVPVLAAGAIQPATNSTPVQIAAVGKEGRRAHVRSLMKSKGYVEGVDFFCAA